MSGSEKKEVCRAITFINYHIPIVIDETEVEYSTVGFFDGMMTERLEDNRDTKELKMLWKYGMNMTEKSRGKYSFQNIFCFGNDEWVVGDSDDKFWDKQTNMEYPLTFVVFLQLQEYRTGDKSIGKQCREFHEQIRKMIKDAGIGYVYCTVDKNDFVVCLKCRNYNNAVETIKSLHNETRDIVYSYSVFSVSNEVLSNLDKSRFPYLYDETISSICMKGIANSYSLDKNFSLDQKYYEYCKKFVSELYDENVKEVDKDYKIYDILGDDDFRLIVRNIKLGRLLRQFAPGEMLNYNEKIFRFYLFSSSIVLNTMTQKKDGIDEETKEKDISAMENNFKASCCNELMKKLKDIKQKIDVNCWNNDKMITIYHALLQLLQSLRTLEMPPTKKYDFYSLYKPLSMMVDIIHDKLCAENLGNEIDSICENGEIYDFIHKISMTLHGTFRTDIQFFQIKDFNVTVHYSPAKLRAFYSLWVQELSDYYKKLLLQNNDEKRDYCFIFAPGIFKETSVKELFQECNENRRLMLITVPERHLYAPRKLSIILAHEVSHFVGLDVDRRKFRYYQWRDCCIRIFCLELQAYRLKCCGSGLQPTVAEIFREPNWLEKLQKQIKIRGEQVLHEEERTETDMGKEKMDFHSKHSFEMIEKTFSAVACNDLESVIAKECEQLGDSIMKLDKRCSFVEMSKKVVEISNNIYDQEKDMMTFYQKFQHNMLPWVLEALHYITSEAYADMSSILTLNLTPQEYICSFRGERVNKIDNQTSRHGGILYVRAGLTMQAILMAIKENEELFADLNKVESEEYITWTEDIFSQLPKELEDGLPEKELAVQIYGYIKYIRDCSVNLENYIRIYNDEKESFINKELDFLNDKMVTDSVLEYLKLSAVNYAKNLEKDDDLKRKREALIKVYRNVTAESSLVMVQEIENFLKDVEKPVECSKKQIENAI